MALTSSAAVGAVEEATQVVGAAVGRTAEVGVWGFLLLFPLPLLPASFQVKHLNSVCYCITVSFLGFVHVWRALLCVYMCVFMCVAGFWTQSLLQMGFLPNKDFKDFLSIP